MKFFAPVESFSGEDILLLRKEAGLTRHELAEYLGVTVKAVESWEYGKSRPSGAVCRLMTLFSDAASDRDRPKAFILPFETLSPREVHFLDGRTFKDPRYHVMVTWKDGGDMLYLDFNYHGRKYHLPARQRYRESEEAFESLCLAGSDMIDNYIQKKEFEKWTGFSDQDSSVSGK